MNEEILQELADEALIKRAKQGGHQAFGVLYERYIDAIFRFIRSRVGDTQTAEDLTEATFLRALEAIDRYREKGLKYSAYLYQVARNLITDHYRQAEENIPLESEVYALVSPESTDDEIARREQVQGLRLALGNLPEEYREVIRLRVLLEIPTVEAAQWMQRSEGATRVLLHRALRALRRELKHSDDI